jgi:hypothetical protein
MSMDRIDFSYEISDERLLAYSLLPILDRLRWLDEVRCFTLMVRQAPTVPRNQGSPTKPEKVPGSNGIRIT